MERSEHRAAARERAIERLDASLADLERLEAPRPIWVGLVGHAEAVLEDWRWSLEVNQAGEFTEGV
jgi:hypothetical protein